MVRTLTGEGVPNITQPTAEYPYGKYKDKTSSSTNDGTELSERTLGDCYQGMLNTITGAGITPNNEPERKGDSQFQKAVELLKPVATCVVGSDDLTTFKVLRSVIRDPEVTLAADFLPLTENAPFLFANFQIKRNGSLDSSRLYIVKASSAYDFATASLLILANLPTVAAAHSPYFKNVSGFPNNVPNLVFFYPNSLAPTDALGLARAVLTIYDAGPAI